MGAYDKPVDCVCGSGALVVYASPLMDKFTVRCDDPLCRFSLPRTMEASLGRDASAAWGHLIRALKGHDGLVSYINGIRSACELADGPDHELARSILELVGDAEDMLERDATGG